MTAPTNEVFTERLSELAAEGWRVHTVEFPAHPVALLEREVS
ncbi:MAG: hypothetical protein ACYDD6_12515 [Acidimicrobiales bacterium]